MTFSMLKKLMAGLTAGALAAASAGQAQACTSILLKTADQDYIYGRTMEFALQLHSQLMVIPRGLAIKAAGPDGTLGAGLAYTSKYGAVGANGLNLPILTDGVNEKGLAGGLLFFPGYAGFQDVPANEAGNSLASYDLLTYLLTNFANVDEVKAGLPRIKVSKAPQVDFKMAVPVHATLHDEQGKSIVIEYVDGLLHIIDNPIGVMTNAPEFSWHMANLGIYPNLTPNPLPPLKIMGKAFPAPSSGANLAGLPGDFSSPSRFLRAAFFASSAPTSANASEGVRLAFHLMNNFDIPPGSIGTSADQAAGGGVAGFETTEWTAVTDIKNRTYYIRTYDNASSRALDLRKADLDAKAIRFYPLDQAEPVVRIAP